MYNQQQSQTVSAMGNWLGETKWDTFSTITYRYDVKAKQNFKIMTDLERHLMTLNKPFYLFWITEYTNYNLNTHNHLLVKGDIVEDINYHLRSKSLIGSHVKHLPYEKSASMYVSKFICDDKIDYGFVKK
jgi:hypothetical protein